MKTNKRKVSTRTIEKNRKVNQIIKILKNFPEGITPKIVAYHSSINVNTIKSLLPQILQVKKKEGIRGIYVLVDESDHGSIFDWNFHNTQLSYIILGYMGKRIKKTYNFEFINYEFEIGEKSKKATLRISTDHPINVSSLCCCYLFFAELIKKYANVMPTPNKVWITSIEFNKDYKNLRLDGPKCITIDSLLTQFKLYDKKSCVRIEHKLKVPINCEIIFSMLSDSTESIEIYHALCELNKKIEIVLDSEKRNIDLMLNLLNKMDKIKC